MQRNVLCLLSSGKIIEATSHYRLTNQTDFHHGLLAKAAELNGYPATGHALELATQLHLTTEQKAKPENYLKHASPRDCARQRTT